MLQRNGLKKVEKIILKEKRWLEKEDLKLKKLKEDLFKLNKLLSHFKKEHSSLKQKIILKLILQGQKIRLKNRQLRIFRFERSMRHFRLKLDKRLHLLVKRLLTLVRAGKNMEEVSLIHDKLENFQREISRQEEYFLRIVAFPNGIIAKELAQKELDWTKINQLIEHAHSSLHELLFILEELDTFEKKEIKPLLFKNNIFFTEKKKPLLNKSLNKNSKIPFHYQIFFEAEDHYKNLIKDIKQSQKCIYLEYYIFEPDNIGREITSALIEKAKEFRKKNDILKNERKQPQHEIIFIIDGLGSPQDKSKIKELSILINQMKDAGIIIYRFNPLLDPLMKYSFLSVIKHPLVSFFGRDHRKLAIIDRNIAHFGGMNIADSYHHIRDTQMRIKGELVLSLVASFFTTLAICRKYEYRTLKKFSELRRERKKEYLHTKNESTITYPEFLYNSLGYKVISNIPASFHHPIRDEYIKFIKYARHNINLISPYFIPGWRFVNELVNAARKGVKVSIILTKQSDHDIVDSSARIFYRKLLEAGVKIYLYQRKNYKMIHAKTMTVDNTYSTIGSSNIDYVSLSLNYELNLFFSYPPIASTLNEQFKEDLKYCKEVTLTEFMKQDKEKPLLEKWKELLGYGILGPLLRPGIRKYY